ncbi:transposable element Tc1 transposase [Trichonephila clavipes]|nr:transposable element Tc1 transposase [Trichonephila clavipes]
MENRKETTIEERKLVIKLSNEGKSQRNIAKVVGRSVNGIQKILQKFKKTGMLGNNEGRGRKKIMKFTTERRVIHQVKIDPKISAPKISACTSNTLGRSVSAETVRKVLRKAGYNGRVARKKPLIGKRNRVKRLKFAKEHILKPQQFWNEVIFSDEPKFNIFGSDGRRMVWRKPNTSYPPKTHNSYCEARRWVGDEWLLYHCRYQLNTPPQSPDLNVIENLWSHLERAVQKHQITSKEQLKSVLQEEWLNIAPKTTRHLVESMPRRLEAVISAKGYATKY